MGLLGSIVGGIEKTFVTGLKLSLMAGVGMATGGVGLLAAEPLLAGILGTGFGGGLLGGGLGGGLLNTVLPMALGNPLTALAPRLGLSGFTGGAMNLAQNVMMGGQSFGIPGMADRVGEMANTTHSYADQIASGGLGNTINEMIGGGTGNIGDVAGTNMSNDERAMLAQMDPKDRARYILQKRMQEKAEIASLLSNLQKMRHDAAMAIIANMR